MNPIPPANLLELTYPQSLPPDCLPDPFRIRHRADLQEVLCAVVRDRRTLPAAVADLTQRGVAAGDLPRLQELTSQELEGLAEHNCARWRLGLREVQLWIGAGRPRD